MTYKWNIENNKACTTISVRPIRNVVVIYPNDVFTKINKYEKI